MKLLFDENLSPRLVAFLADVFPGSAHVHEAGLGRADDQRVWEYAHDHQFTLVSKDSDFYDLSMLRGYPPKVIWLKRGNCSTKQIELILRNQAEKIKAFIDDPQNACLLLL